MMWPEVETAEREQRHELVLQGKTVAERVDKNDGAVDEKIFSLVKLNFLEVSEARLRLIPESISSLTNLTSLVLKHNSLSVLPDSLSSLTKLKLLDVSSNKITKLPTFSQFTQLTSLNLSLNSLEGSLAVEGLDQCCRLSVVDLSGNQLSSLHSLEQSKLPSLSELTTNHNKIESLSSDVATNWPALKKLDLSNNSLKSVPQQLSSLKLKDLSLVNNPLVDNRLRKMCEQTRAKSVLDYIKANGGKEEAGKKSGKKGKKGDHEKKSVEEDETDELCQTLKILGISEDYPEIAISETVKEVRPYLVCCYVKNLDLSGENMKKFLTLQTKLHKTVCENRTVATIATHDVEKISGDLVYTAKPPQDLSIIPLMSTTPSSATKLVNHLKSEAEALRKEKKRSQVTGLHQYLHILDRWPVYPCMMSGDSVISFPPITNSALTKLSESSTTVLIEVTSSTRLGDAKQVLDTLLLEMTSIWSVLTVVQARVVTTEGELKVTYPSKADLASADKTKIKIVR